MAKKEHLAQLKQGLHAWYRWREAYPDIAPDLRGANLRDARLRGMNLRGANLSRAHLDEAELIEVDLLGADLREAIFSKARLGWADLAGARIGWTTFGDTDLGMARGLETVRHIGPSTIGIDTLYRSGGNIPEVFLRGAGVPNEMITYSKSLVGQRFQYYSCFISYSSHDEALAQRLHADLRDQGMRCWFAPEDLKIGDECRSRIDESIQVYDRLLLILSEQSVKSHWVQKESKRPSKRSGRRIGSCCSLSESMRQSCTVQWAGQQISADNGISAIFGSGRTMTPTSKRLPDYSVT